MIMVIIILLKDKKLRLSLAGIVLYQRKDKSQKYMPCQSIWIETPQQYCGSEH